MIFTSFLKFAFQMMECGNDRPEKDVDDEVIKIVEDVQPQLEEKLGKSLGKLEPTRFSSQVSQNLLRGI